MTKKITHQRLYNITLYYLSKYDASIGKVRQMLKRRVMKAANQGQEIPSNTNKWIDDIIDQVVRLGYVDDKRYGENQIRMMTAQGKSNRFMALKLAQAGLASDLVDELLQSSETDDLYRAQAFVRKKKIGWLRPENSQKEYYKKDLQTLARAGFLYETAIQALKMPEDL